MSFDLDRACQLADGAGYTPQDDGRYVYVSPTGQFRADLILAAGDGSGVIVDLDLTYGFDETYGDEKQGVLSNETFTEEDDFVTRVCEIEEIATEML